MAHSSSKRGARKPGRPSGKPKAYVPPKPYKDFPLTPQSGGYWAKRINGKLHYFGRWGKRVDGKMVRLDGDGWEQALAKYTAQRDRLYAGLPPEPEPDPEPEPEPLALDELCDYFMQSKLNAKKAGKLSPGMWHEYDRTCNLLMAVWGKNTPVAQGDKLLLKPRYFSDLMAVLEERFGPVRQVNEITRVKTLFKWAEENEEIPHGPKYGSEFKKPSRVVLRNLRNENGEKLWPVEDLRTAIDKANVPLKAWLLLGANCAFYAKDCADLPSKAVDLDGGWLAFPRKKTGVLRRAKLWPETITALRDYLAVRPEPKDDTAKGRFFVTERGKAYKSAAIGRTAGEHIRGLGLSDKLQFAWLRHTFRTAADSTLDRVAIHSVMGHVDNSIDDTYRENIAFERLERVAETVRVWLYSPVPGGEKKEGGVA